MTKLGAEIPLHIEQEQGGQIPGSGVSFTFAPDAARLDPFSPLELLQAAVAKVTASRAGYGVPGMEDLEPHSSAHLSCRIFNSISGDLWGPDGPQMTIEAYYIFEQAQRLARIIAANQRGEEHPDSGLDILGYGSLAAQLHGPDKSRILTAVAEREHQLKCE